MEISLNLISSICWEIITKHTVQLNVETLPVFKLLSDSVYDFSPKIQEQNLRIFWRYSPKGFLEITDYFSLCSFLNLSEAPAELYLIMGDAENFYYTQTETFLRVLDLIEMKRVKELERNKYDLKSEVDEIENEIQQCKKSLSRSSSSLNIENQGDEVRNILKFALRKMPIRRCYTTDICSGYSLIDCVRKAMKGRIINCSPHQDIYFLETHAKNEESNLENLFVSPAGREMLKYKPTAKFKQKTNLNLEFFTTTKRQSSPESTMILKTNEKCDVTASSTIDSPSTSSSTSDTNDSEKKGIDLYEEAAAILGLNCSESDDCRCIECQCHYFDFEEEIDFPATPTGNDYGKLLNVDHTSSCSIQ